MMTSENSLTIEPLGGAEQLLAAAREMRPVLREQGARIEEQRRVPTDLAEKIEAAGLWSIFRPEAYGGHVVTRRQYVDIIGELGRGDGSVACLTGMISGGNKFQWLYPSDVQEEFYSDPHARAAVVFAVSRNVRRVDGGWVISGKWPYGTGSLYATWVNLAFDRVAESGASQGRGFALVPLSEATLEDTWSVIGMVGTASWSVVLDEVFVPDRRVIDWDGLLSEVPGFGLGSSLNVIAPVVGIAEGLLDSVREKLTQERPIVHTAYKRAIDSPTIQLNIADATQLIDSARMHLNRAAQDLDDAAAEGRTLSAIERARVRADVGWTAQRTQEAAQLLLNVGGASGFMLGSPIQRYWRDLEMGSRHGYTNFDIAREAYGKALLGFDTATVTETI